jgi:glycosyltransferase involved in cell wall biosynthesis
MRIAYVCADPGVPVFGGKGCSVHVQEVVRALRAEGAEVELFAARSGGDARRAGWGDLLDVRVRMLPPLPTGDPGERERAALALNGHLYAALEQAGPFDLIYERYSLWNFTGMEYAQDRGIPALLEVNAPLIEEQATHRKLLNGDKAAWVARKVFGSATALLAVSEEVAAYLRTFPEARGRIHVVPNGVNPGRFPATIAPTYRGEAETFTIGFAGTLKPWHGLPGLVEAFSLLHERDGNVRLLVVGDGPERRYLTDGLLADGLAGAAHFTGAVAPQDVPGLLASMDVAVAPYPASPRFYFSPLKVFEYMAAARPVVASKVGQIDGLIRDGVNGILCPPSDSRSLAEALDRLRCDPALRARLGKAARDTVLRDHTWEAVARRIMALARRDGSGEACFTPTTLHAPMVSRR